MAKFTIKKSETSVILTVFIRDSSSSVGAGLSGLDNTSNIVGGYVKRNGTGVALAVDEIVATPGTYEAPSTSGQVRIGIPANQRTGAYELHFHNDLFTTADWVTITLGGAADMAELQIEVQMDDNIVKDIYDLLNVTAHTLPAKAAPTKTPTWIYSQLMLYKALVNKTKQSSTLFEMYNNAGSVVDHQSTDTNISGTRTSGDMVEGA